MMTLTPLIRLIEQGNERKRDTTDDVRSGGKAARSRTEGERKMVTEEDYGGSKGEGGEGEEEKEEKRKRIREGRRRSRGSR